MNTEKLRELAYDAQDQASTVLAITLAAEDGELSEDEAKRAIELHHNDDSLALIRSEVYPGDEYFDESIDELSGRWFA